MSYAMKCHGNISGLVLMSKSRLFGRTVSVLEPVLNKQFSLPYYHNQILREAVNILKRIIGNMRFVRTREADPKFPPTHLNDEIANYIVHCAYDYIGQNDLIKKGVIRGSEFWEYFKNIHDAIEAAVNTRDLLEFSQYASIAQGIEFFKYLKVRFWEEGEKRTLSEMRSNDAD